MVFISSSSDSEHSETDESSEAEFRPPAGLAVKVIRRRITLRSSPRKCQSIRKILRTSPRNIQNSPTKQIKDLSPVKVAQKNQKSCNLVYQEKSLGILRKPKRKNISDPVAKNIQMFDIACNNTTSPLKIKKKFVKDCFSDDENKRFEKAHKHKLNSLVALSPEFGHVKKKRLTSSGGKILTESYKKHNSPFSVKEQRIGFSPKLNDFSNPFDEDSGDDDKQYLCINRYKRRMRDLVDLYRFLNQPDIYGFCPRPVYQPFLTRNLFYMRKQRPCDPVINTENSYEKHQQRTRTASRASDKIPTTVKFTLIRNYNCFGNKTAIVQCYHVTELNGRFSQLKRIPSANFEKAVNERVSSYIDIDMLEECQLGALEDRNARAEHFVVRVVFRLEDAEIGGRHLRKMASRQSDESLTTKCLRKNGPNDVSEVVMFGSVRIFSYSPEQGLRVLTGETSILLSTVSEFGLDDLNTKSSVGQVTRLINLSRKCSGRGSVPFIRIIVLNEEEEEAEDEKAESEKQNRNIRDSSTPNLVCAYERRSLDRMVSGLLKMEMDVAESITFSNLTNEDGRKTGDATKRHKIQKSLLELPEKIAYELLLMFFNDFYLASNFCSIRLILPYPVILFSTMRNFKEFGTIEGCVKSRWNVPKTNLLDSLSTEDEQGIHNNCDDNSIGFKLILQIFIKNLGQISQSDDCNIDTKMQTKDSPMLYSLRILSLSDYSPCFFCNAKLRLNNLWTLYKHLRFVHPRFIFTFEPSIIVTDKLILPGFSVSLNIHFDSLFELMPIKSKFSRLHSSKIFSFENRHVQPIWLVTRELSRKIRANIDFPIERFTTITQTHYNELGYQFMGCFDFDVPTKLDQQWLIQSGSRKLEDITDLHPAERIMMQMWNAFLPGVHITMLARKMTYKAARIFVSYNWRQIEQLKLRTHFLLLLSTLLNLNAIDEEERYDLLMRLDPKYAFYDDTRHYVTRELTLLEKERRNSQRGGNNDDEISHFGSKDDLVKLKNKKETKMTEDKKIRHNSGGQVTSLPLIEFNSLLELRNRYPFASGKRLGNIWKFIRPYDFNDFSLQISTAQVTKSHSLQQTSS